MTDGLKVYDQNGNLTLDATSRPPKLLGVIENVTSIGSVAVKLPDDSYNVWFYCQSAQNYGAGRAIPIITLTGNIISWRFLSSVWINPAPTNIFYGVY